MKYLRKFETEAEYNAAQRSSVKSYVSLISENGSIKYDKPLSAGVYIQHIDGSAYTADDWSMRGYSAEQANGVAVIDNLARFVIAKNDVEKKCKWSEASNSIEGITTTTNKDLAKSDYAGLNNTTILAATNSSEAASACVNFKFPNGKSGHIPALGEWMIAYKHKEEIILAMSLIGGNEIGSYYWSSTQYDNYYAWYFGWGTAYADTNGKGAPVLVRPFTTV